MPKSLTDLNSTTYVVDNDVLLVRQGTEDKQSVLSQVKNYVLNDTEDILPEMTGASGSVSTRSIGSATQKYYAVYADEVFVGASSLYVNGKKVIEDNSNVIEFKTDPDQSVNVKVTGAGDLSLLSDDLISSNAKGGLQLIVPSNNPSKHIEITNQSSGGQIMLNSGDEIDLTAPTLDFNGEVHISSGLTVAGNLTVQGTTTTVNTTEVNIADNLIVVNSNQTGIPTSTLRGGIVVERGDESNYEFVFVEEDDVFKVGMVGQLQSVATREDTPASNALPYWNSTSNMFESSSVTVSGSTIAGSLSGNASTASALETARTISLTGDVTGNVSFNGSSNVSITTTVTDDSHTHDTRYFTETEITTNYYNKTTSDSRFVNVTGDNMTGDLTINSRRVVTVSSGTTFPASPGLGDEVYRTDFDEWYKYNGSVWTQI